jgi:ribosomal protein S18 acetylase RimI-like enzyme
MTSDHNMLTMDVTLRAATSEDKEWIYEVKKQAYHHYVENIWGWDEAWQRNNFESEYDRRVNFVVMLDDQLVGWLQLEYPPYQVYLGNIAILDHYQGRGIGTAVLTRIIGEASASSRSVALQVFKTNPRATALYERLGFRRVGETATHFRLQCECDGRICDAHLSDGTAERTSHTLRCF